MRAVVRDEREAGPGLRWVVRYDEKEVGRFSGRAAARIFAANYVPPTPVFEEKERNPFIEGPAPTEPSNNQTAEVVEQFMKEPTP